MMGETMRRTDVRMETEGIAFLIATTGRGAADMRWHSLCRNLHPPGRSERRRRVLNLNLPKRCVDAHFQSFVFFAAPLFFSMILPVSLPSSLPVAYRRM